MATVTELGPYDVLLGRCASAYNNVGNRRFRVLISMNLQLYLKAKTRKARTMIIRKIAQTMINDIGMRFVKKQAQGSTQKQPKKMGAAAAKKGQKAPIEEEEEEEESYVVLDQKQVMEKIGHSLRDLAATHTKGEHVGPQQVAEDEVVLPATGGGDGGGQLR